MRTELISYKGLQMRCFSGNMGASLREVLLCSSASRLKLLRLKPGMRKEGVGGGEGDPEAKVSVKPPDSHV